MAKRSTPTVTPTRTELLGPRESARAKLQERITEGQKLLEIKLSSVSEFESLKERHKSWTKYNDTLLGTLFSGTELQHEYGWCASAALIVDQSITGRARALHERIKAQVGCLTSIVE